MKKSFKIYAICWFILLALFNVICFVTPNTAKVYENEYIKFGGAFWTGYIFITLAFIGQLICAYFALKEENRQKLFYRLPLITVSYTGLILTVVFGGICMAIPDMPNWAGAIICLVILAFNAIAVIKAFAAGEIAVNIDEKVKAKTLFAKSLTVDAEGLLTRAQTEEIKAECKKVYEAVRFSDPMSHDALSGIESQITINFAEFSNAVADNDTEAVKNLAKDIIILIGDRNKKCKLLK